MEERTDRKNKVFKIVLGGLVVCVVVLLAAIIAVAMTREKVEEEVISEETVEEETEVVEVEMTEEERKQREIRNEVYNTYLENDENIEVVVDAYDSYIRETNVLSEKVDYLGNKIKLLNLLCGWTCAEQILDNINTLEQLDPEATKTVTICELRDAYSMEEISEECIRIIEEANEQE